MLIPPYLATLARVREVLELHSRGHPGFPPRSVELEDCTRTAARAAVRENVPLVMLVADLERLATEVLEHTPRAAVEAAAAMACWATRECHALAGMPVAAGTPRRDERRLTGRAIAARHARDGTPRRSVAADHRPDSR